MVDGHTLLHGEALLVMTTSDAEDVALELLTKEVTRNLVRDALVVEGTTTHNNQRSKRERTSKATHSLRSSSISMVFWAL